MSNNQVVGRCPWCERDGQILRYEPWTFEGKVYFDWTCQRCQDEAHQLELRHARIAGEQTEPAE